MNISHNVGAFLILQKNNSISLAAFLETVHWCVIMPPDKSADSKIVFLFLNKTYVVGTQKNRLNGTVLLSTHNIHVC